MGRKALLACGAASSLLYVAMNVFVAMQWEGYSSASRTVSELSAVGAPTRPLWVALAFGYTGLVISFGFGVLAAAGNRRPLRIVGALLIAYGLTGLVWPFAPMHQRAVLAAGGGNLSDAMHIALTMVTIPLMLLAMGFGASAFGRRFRLYSFATMAFLVAFGILVGMDAPRISADLPTPMIGVWERIDIALFLAWVVLLAVTLLRDQAGQAAGARGAA